MRVLPPARLSPAAPAGSSQGHGASDRDMASKPDKLRYRGANGSGSILLDHATAARGLEALAQSHRIITGGKRSDLDAVEDTFLAQILAANNRLAVAQLARELGLHGTKCRLRVLFRLLGGDLDEKAPPSDRCRQGWRTRSRCRSRCRS